MSKNKVFRGLTMIELLIVLTILGILALLALPSFSEYVMRSRRSEGTTALNNINLAQGKYRSNNAAYANLATLWPGTTSTENGHYDLAITSQTATGYTATATAKNGQVDDAQSGTSCAILTLTVNGLTSTRAPATCWNR